MRNEAECLEIAVDLVKRLSGKLDYVRCYVAATDEKEMEVRDGHVENASMAEQVSLTVVGARQGRTASISAGDVSSRTLASISDTLADLVAVVEPDPWYVVPDPAEQGAAEAALDLADPGARLVGVEDLKKAALALEKQALERDNRLRSSGAAATVTATTVGFACSHGFHAAFSRTSYSRGVSLVVDDPSADGENRGRKQRGGWFHTATHEADLEANDAIAETAAQRVLSRIGAVKPETGRYPVIFDAITASIFFNQLANALSGGRLYRKESFLCDSMHETIADRRLTVTEDPLIPRGLGSRRFDLDGVRSRRFPVVADGQVVNYLLGVYAAHRLGLNTNGCAGGSANFVVRPGKGDFQALAAELKDGILVTGLMGQGADIRTGDFSMGAEGFRIRNGVIEEPLSEFTISSTFREMLTGLDAIGDDVRTASTVRSPSIRFRELTIGGR